METFYDAIKVEQNKTSSKRYLKAHVYTDLVFVTLIYYYSIEKPDSIKKQCFLKHMAWR